MSKHFTIVHLKGGIVQNIKPLTVLLQSLKDGKYLLEISGADKRSNPQNRYLHGILIPEFRLALNEVGYDEVKTNEQAKSIMKSMFLNAEIVKKETGEMIKYIKNTSELTKEELNILIDEVIKFSAENMNYIIPYPNEQMELHYD